MNNIENGMLKEPYKYYTPEIIGICEHCNSLLFSNDEVEFDYNFMFHKNCYKKWLKENEEEC